MHTLITKQMRTWSTMYVQSVWNTAGYEISQSDTLKLHNNNVSSCYTPSYRLWNMVGNVVTLVVHIRRCTSWICLSDFHADQLVISISDSIVVISCTSAYQTLVKCMGTRLTLINSTNPQSVVHSHSLTPPPSLLSMLAPF